MADFPTTAILDTFTRADQGPPPSANWTTGVIGGTSGLKVVSNRCAANATTDPAADGYWNAANFGPDSEAYCTVTTVPTGAAFMRLYLRLANIGASTTNGYLAVFQQVNWLVFRLDISVATLVAIIDSPPFVDTDSVGFVAIGPALALFKNGAQVLSATDGVYSAAGKLGLAQSDIAIRSQNFGGGNSTFNPSTLSVTNIDLTEFPKPVLAVPKPEVID